MGDVADDTLEKRIKDRGGDKLPQGGYTGPGAEPRGCTDILCLILFVACWVGMVVLGGFAFKQGQPQRLYKGYDFEGVVCGEGINAGLTQVYYPLPPRLTYSVCLPECPRGLSAIKCARDVWSGAEAAASVGSSTQYPCNTTLEANSDTNDPYKIKQVTACLYNFTKMVTTLENATYGWCFPTYPTAPLNIKDGFARCLPAIFNKTIASGAKFVNKGVNNTETNFDYTSFEDVYQNPGLALSQIISNVANHWPYIAASAAIALGISLIYTQILRFAAGIVAWFTLIAFELLLIALAVLLNWKAGVLQPDHLPESMQTYAHAATNEIPFNFKTTEDQQKIVLAMGIVMAILAFLGLIFIFVMCSRINLAIKVIKQASRALANLPLLLILPVLTWVFIVILFVWWIVVLLFLFSAGEFNQDTHRYELNERLKQAAAFHLFMLLWTKAFYLAVSDLTMAYAVSEWYWADQGTVIGALCKTVRYHMGTAAFGSFLIALIQFIRMVVRYYTSKMKELEKNSSIVKAIRCCTECCLACLERFLKFASRQAYVQTSMHGMNFCRGAMAAFSLLLRNTLRLAAITVVSSIFLLLGKAFIAVATSVIGAFLIVNAADGGFSDITNADPISVLLIFLLAFAVATAFMAVYETVIDTMFQCYCEEYERTNGAPGAKNGEFHQLVKDHEIKPSAPQGQQMTQM